MHETRNADAQSGPAAPAIARERLTSTASTGPLPRAGRLALIDTLRAVALFGVIVMNLLSMVMFFLADEVMGKASPTDVLVGLGDLVFLQGKARSCFAFLFGVGFGVMLLRAEATGPSFNRFYWRRMTVLLAFGVINQWLLFWGDILAVYALVGATLPWFRRLSDAALLRTAMVLVLVVPLLHGLWNMSGAEPAAPVSDEAMTAWTTAALDAFRHAPYGPGIWWLNFECLLQRWGSDPVHMAVYVIGVLGLFLLGMWVARRGILFDVEPHRALLRRVAWIGLPVGLVLSVAFASQSFGLRPQQPLAGMVIASYLGLPVMAMGYVALFALWLSRGGMWFQHALAPVGRMALTNYLASGLIGALVYHGYGLGWMGRLSMSQMNVLAVGVFVALALFSHAWLRVFRHGPLEWIWRCSSHGKWQPLRMDAR